VRSYSALLRTPHVAALVAASLLARLPIGINGLATILFLRDRTGSFAIAGAAAGAMALGNGIGNPIEARLVDRSGVRILLGLAFGHVAGLVALFALGEANAPAALLIFVSFAAGALLPPVSMVLRALYPKLAPDHVQVAYAMDSVITETIFVVGPLLTGALVAIVSPGAALFLSAAAVVAGAAWFLAALPTGLIETAGATERRDLLGALRSPGIRTIVVTMLPVGFAFGALEVAIPAFADEQGHRELAGVLIAVWSIASAVGGLVYGARTWSWSLARIHLAVTIVLPAGFMLILLAGSTLTMALLVIPAGVFIAPLIATRNELTGLVAPPGFVTEAFTWPVTALVAGIAAGAAVSGALAESVDWRAAVIAGTIAAALGGVVAVARRNTLRLMTSA
jgi:MFS family permease